MSRRDDSPRPPTQESRYELRKLRDYFAGQVISQCHITADHRAESADPEVVRVFAERIAKSAYIIADAMMRERAK